MLAASWSPEEEGERAGAGLPSFGDEEMREFMLWGSIFCRKHEVMLTAERDGG